MIFSKRSKKQNHISHHVSPCTEFNHAMAAMQYCVDTQQNLTEKLAAIDYFMRVIKMDTQSDFLSSIIYWCRRDFIKFHPDDRLNDGVQLRH